MKPSTSSPSFDRFLEAMARALGTSKDGLERLLFQEQRMTGQQRDPLRTAFVKNKSRSKK